MLWARMFLDDVLSKTSTWHNVSFENVENNLQMSYMPFSLSLKEAISTRSSPYVYKGIPLLYRVTTLKFCSHT